ncbi:MAG: ATP-binding protein [Pikeienuella sp.]
MSFNLLLTVCALYASGLFLIAWQAERRAKDRRMGILRSPIIYTLSISVYCTAWTYYGAVGSAARNGMEFVTIYLGPTLVFIGWWWLLRKLVRVGRAQRVTSIADLISSRYGKSTSLAVIVTVLAVVGATPYIALQLQSLTLSFSVFAEVDGGQSPDTIALWVAIGLAVFTIIFGTRNLDANERHHGVVTAIAVEAIVKLGALVAVGVFAVWGVADGPADIFARMNPDMLRGHDVFSGRWVALIFLSATAIICLPRMFQVIVVESADERHLGTASWAFPLYLFLMSLFVMPIAIAGLAELPADANPDLFVLTLPLAHGREGLATLAFLGGFSAATSMVIVAAIALSTMVSNHIVLPIWLRLGRERTPASDDVRSLLLRSRRLSIAIIIGFGYFYYQVTGGTGALASIGLIAFLGVAQVLPALLGGLFWQGATRRGAQAGIVSGFFLWAYTLFLPSFQSADMGYALEALNPQSLFGLAIDDPLIHAMVWSLGVNTATFIIVSLATYPNPVERLQGLQFVGAARLAPGSGQRRSAAAEELLVLAQRILGRREGIRLFNDTAAAQGKPDGLPNPTDEFIATLEREFAGSVGAATAHAMISQVAAGEAISVADMIAVADETAHIMEYSAQLETQSIELARTAQQLRSANQKLTALSAQKDTFLSQVSHELRTPMTSIRSFAEILRDGADLPPEQAKRYSSIIHDESIRLTRLLDDILDLSFLENGRIKLDMAEVRLSAVLDRALSATELLRSERDALIKRDALADTITLNTDFDRLAQVFINLISNAIRHGGTDQPNITIRCTATDDAVHIDVADNGPGISREHVELIFEKFSKLSSEMSSGSAGLGLPISREIMRNLNGGLDYIGRRQGAVFRVSLPQG